MAGHDPAIHDFICPKTWMPGPGHDEVLLWRKPYLIPSFALSSALTACGLALPPVAFIT